MRTFGLSLLVLLGLAVVPAPAGNSSAGCGFAPATDINIQRLDRTQSAGAAKICAMYLNTYDARLAR